MLLVEQQNHFSELLVGLTFVDPRMLPNVRRALYDFRGRALRELDPNQQNLFMIRKPSGSGAPWVLQVTARITGEDKQEYVGHRAMYDQMVLDTAGIVELVATDAWLVDLNAIEELLRHIRIIQLRGGKHAGPAALPGVIEEQLSARGFDDYDAVADAIEACIVRAALEHPEIYIDATCRGLQLLLAILTNRAPAEVSGHQPEEGTEDFRHGVANVYQKLYHAPTPQFLLGDFEVNSNHAQGYPLEELRPMLDKLREQGWYLTHVSDDAARIVEQIVRIDANGRITAIARQFHPERMNTSAGQEYRNWNKHQMQRALA